MTNKNINLEEAARIFRWQINDILLCVFEVLALNEIDSSLMMGKRAHNFFYAANEAMKYKFTFAIARLFDTDSDCINFLTFKNKVINEGDCTSAALDEFKIKYKECKKDIINIINRRNKILAHNDAEFFYDIRPCNEENRFSLERIVELLRIMRSICNDYLKKYGTVDDNYRLPEYTHENNFDDVKHLFGLKTLADISLEDDE